MTVRSPTSGKPEPGLQAPQQQDPLRADKGSILVIDDDMQLLTLTSLYLKRAGFHVKTVSKANLAMSEIRSMRPDLILLDVMMPEISGFNLCRIIKDDPSLSHIPIIFLTALQLHSDKMEGFRAGAADYVIKPFEFEELNARVQAHITIRHQRQALERLSQRQQQFFVFLAEEMRKRLAHFSSIKRDLQREMKPGSSPSLAPLLLRMESEFFEVTRFFDQLLAWGHWHMGSAHATCEIGSLSQLELDQFPELQSRFARARITLNKPSMPAPTAWLDSAMATKIGEAFWHYILWDATPGQPIEQEWIIEMAHTGIRCRFTPRNRKKEIDLFDLRIPSEAEPTVSTTDLSLPLIRSMLESSGGSAQSRYVDTSKQWELSLYFPTEHSPKAIKPAPNH